MSTCVTCGGTGWVYDQPPGHWARGFSKRPCPVCDGTGRRDEAVDPYEGLDGYPDPPHEE